jgi:hypothetical protein
LPCGPRIAEEKESVFPDPSRFKSAWWPRQRRGKLEGGGCGGVVVKAEGVLGVVYKVGEVIQVWVRKGGVFGGVAVKAEGVLGVVYEVGHVMQV